MEEEEENEEMDEMEGKRNGRLGFGFQGDVARAVALHHSYCLNNKQ